MSERKKGGNFGGSLPSFLGEVATARFIGVVARAETRPRAAVIFSKICQSLHIHGNHGQSSQPARQRGHGHARSGRQPMTLKPMTG